MALMETLDASARQLVLTHLPHDRSDAAVTSALHGMSTSDLLIKWFNWNSRLIPANPRKVHQSKEFQANKVVTARKPEIDALISEIEAGTDLTKYLSRGVKHGYIDPTGIKSHLRQDMDLMLSAWGIHHLHTSQVVESDGFVERDGYIVFAVFKHDAAYLIDLMTHKDWVNEHVLQVLVDNWPDTGLIHEVKGVVGLSRTLNDSQRLTLRKKHANTAAEINGNVYMPAAGMVASGASLHSVRQADRVCDALERFAKYYENSRGEFLKSIPPPTVWPNKPNFAVEFQPRSMGVSELTTGIYFQLLP